MGGLVAVGCVVGLLSVAYAAPRARIEVASAVVAGVLLLATQATDPSRALDAVRPLLPVVAFLAAILVVAELCRQAGLFTALGHLLRNRVPERRLLLAVFAIAAAVTATLNLDATVVLFTPVVVVAAASLGARAALVPARLANSASLFLPISNLTNLLALPYLAVGFVEWARIMLPVGLVVLVVEYVGLRLVGPRGGGPAPIVDERELTGPRLPVFTLAVVALMLVGFAVAGSAHLPEWVVATAAAAVLALAAGVRRDLALGSLARSVRPSFAVWVLALAVSVAALGESGLTRAVEELLPQSVPPHAVLTVIGIGLLSMAVANVLNNLPAALLLLPLMAPLGETAVFACLIGLNAGAGLTYTGSLANLLWLRTIREIPESPAIGFWGFHRVGLIVTPVAVVVGATVLALTGG